MTGLQYISCFGGPSNTGQGPCLFDPDLIKMGILIPKGKTYTPAQIASPGLLALLITDAKAVNVAARIYPIKDFEGMESTSEDRVQQTGGYGRRRTVRRGKISWSFQMWGSKCLHTALMEFDDRAGTYDLLLVDANGVVLGYKNSAGNFAGYSLSDLYVGDYMLGDGTNGAMWDMDYELIDSNQWNKQSCYIATSNAYTDLSGLQNIQITDVTSTIVPAPATGTYHLKITSGCGAVNLATIYPTEIIIASNYTAANNTTGAAQTITSRSVSSAGNLVVVFDTADPDWVAGNDVLFCAANTAGLEANGIIGFEANPACVVLPN